MRWGQFSSPSRGSSAGNTSFQSFDTDSPVRQKPGQSQPTSKVVQQKINKLASLGLDWALPKHDVVVVEHGVEKLNLKESVSPPTTPVNSGPLGFTPPQSGGIAPAAKSSTKRNSGGFTSKAAQSGPFPPPSAQNGEFMPAVVAFPPPPIQPAVQTGAFAPPPVQSEGFPPAADGFQTPGFPPAPTGGFPPAPTGGFTDTEIPVGNPQFGEAQWGDMPTDAQTSHHHHSSHHSKHKKKKKRKDSPEPGEWGEQAHTVTFGEAEEIETDGESRITDIVASEPAEVLEITMTFVPGAQLGIDADFETTGKIFAVNPGLQAADAGVQPGWRIIKVNGENYTEQLLDQSLAGSEPFTITFATKELSTPDTDAFQSPPDSPPPEAQNEGRPGRPPQSSLGRPKPKKKKGWNIFCCGSSNKKPGQLSDADDD